MLLLRLRLHYLRAEGRELMGGGGFRVFRVFRV